MNTQLDEHDRRGNIAAKRLVAVIAAVSLTFAGYAIGHASVAGLGTSTEVAR